jgi:integrase
MQHLSPPTPTHCDQKAIHRAMAYNPRDYLIYSLALGTGLRLAEIVGLNDGDVYSPEGQPRNSIRTRTPCQTIAAIPSSISVLLLPDGWVCFCAA